jgi:hypothetical protein
VLCSEKIGENVKYKSLFIGANPQNCTDGVIFKGTQNLLPDHEIFHLIIKDFRDMDDHEFMEDQEFDYIIYAGSPFIWDQFQHSAKWRNTMKCRKIHSEAKMVFFGIGTCMNTKDIDSEIMRRPEDIEFLQQTYENSKVIVRESLAHEILKNASVDSTVLPCPSYFAYNSFPESTKIENGENILIWYPPWIGVSRDDWKTWDKCEAYVNVCKAFIEKFDPKIYCAAHEDILRAQFFGIKEPIEIGPPEKTLEIMSTANYVLSGRVHCAVPGFIQGKAIGIQPVDSRVQVLTEFGCPSIETPEDLDKLKFEVRNFEKYRKLYKI